jgi:hypothetical protein
VFLAAGVTIDITSCQSYVRRSRVPGRRRHD